MTLFPVFYLAPVEYYFILLKSSSVIFEVNEHFKKQTYRNRCCIYGANGKLNLIIPVKHTGERTLIRDVKIANENNWQKIHWRSIEAAYRTSPYFEFYEHIFAPYYEKKYEFLADFNFALHEEILKILEVEISSENTSAYQEGHFYTTDLRNYFSMKNQTSFVEGANPQTKSKIPEYSQVFADKFGFIPNLSIIDLIFILGNSSVTYLKSITHKTE